MADSILKLKVESSEYDAKLKKAAEGIRHLAEVAHKGGGELTGLEQSELDYIKALGDMETKSKSASGQVRELTNTYKELKVVYDNLNEVEKADEGGKALASGLETLKLRAQEAQAQLNNASKSLQENANAGKEDSSVLDALAKKFTINIDALSLLDKGLSVVSGALDVAKDAFFQSETNVDDWGRTVRASEGIYQSFLQSLNTGDFSGFLNNISKVTQAARDAYNALDELSTRMTVINPERAKLQARQQELRAIIRRNGADSEAGKKAQKELKKLEPQLSKSYQTESKMNYNAFEKLVRERLSEGGINLDQKSFNQFMATFSSDAAFQRLRKNAKGSLTTEFKNYQNNGTSTIAGGYSKTVDTRNTEQKLLDLFTDEWRQANTSFLSAAYQAKGAAASNALGNSRYLKGGGGGKGGKKTQAEIIAEQEAAVAAGWQYAMLKGSGAAERGVMADMPSVAAILGDAGMRQMLGINPQQTFDLGKDISTKWKVNKKGQLTDKTDKQERTSEEMLQGTQTMVGSLQSIVSGIEQLGIELPQGMKDVLGALQVITGIVGSIQTIITVGQFLGIFNHGGVVRAANGWSGVVPGNHYSGDTVPALLNSNELVLNQAQTSMLATKLSGNGIGNLTFEMQAAGEQLLIVANNTLKRRGKGEIATWR